MKLIQEVQMGCSVVGKYAQMLFISKNVTLIHFSSFPPKNILSKSDQNLSIKFRGLFCGEPETRARSILFRGERWSNNNTKVVMSMVDIAVYEDDKKVSEIDKCNAHTRDVVGYIWVVCKKGGPTEWIEQMAISAPQTEKWVGKGDILGVVIYV